MKQAIGIEKIPDESTPEPEPAPVEKPPEPAITNDQPIAPTDAIDENGKKEDEPESTDEPPKNSFIELKPTSACKILHSFDHP